MYFPPFFPPFLPPLPPSLSPSLLSLPPFPPSSHSGPADVETYVYDYRGLKVRKSSLTESPQEPPKKPYRPHSARPSVSDGELSVCVCVSSYVAPTGEQLVLVLWQSGKYIAYSSLKTNSTENTNTHICNINFS